jgi:hypothetical protein
MAKDERARFELKLDGYTENRLEYIMNYRLENGKPLFMTKSEAIQDAIKRLATDIEQGKFSQKGRKF